MRRVLQLDCTYQGRARKMSVDVAEVKTSDYVQKLLKMHEKASEANLLDALQASQIVIGVRTWVSKWSVVTRVPLVWVSVHGSVTVSGQKVEAACVYQRSAALKSTEKFRFVMALYIKAGLRAESLVRH